MKNSVVTLYRASELPEEAALEVVGRVLPGIEPRKALSILDEAGEVFLLDGHFAPLPKHGFRGVLSILFPYF